MQATTLTFVIVATQIGLTSGQVSQATGAALLAAALLSATIFPAAAVKLLAAVSLSTAGLATAGLATAGLAAVSPRAERGRPGSARDATPAGQPRRAAAAGPSADK